jgi:arylsulfatase A-like enzyme
MMLSTTEPISLPESPLPSPSTRRQWLRAAGTTAAASSLANAAPDPPAKPNIVLIISDQFRADNLGCLGHNPLGLTPNLDSMARRGTLFRSAYCNQPVCAPARGCIFTSQYPARHGVWRNGLGLRTDAVTLATELRKAGYSANYIGKWHLSPYTNPESRGPVSPEHRGGFLDLWEASNELEWTSHPFEGDLYDGDGRPIHFSNTYRADFMTERAARFLKTARSPFLLVLSYLEVHHQNDIDKFVSPAGYADRYRNPFIPHDLRPLPGSWPSQLSDYYGCVAKMDETVGKVNQLLEENGFGQNTIVAFISDHGCHFRTRNTEYKRSPHDSSTHIPLVIAGPGFNRSLEINELVSQVDLTPSLLSAAGLTPPDTMQGHSFLPLLDRKTENWRNEVYFEMHEFVTGCGIRTPSWTYSATAPKRPGWKPAPSADLYVESAVYDNAADPFQHVNLAGRATARADAEKLRTRLLARVHEASGQSPAIEPAWFPYP